MTAQPAEESTTHWFAVTSINTERLEVTNWYDEDAKYVNGYSDVTACTAVYTLTWRTSNPPQLGSIIEVEMRSPKGPGQ